MSNAIKLSRINRSLHRSEYIKKKPLEMFYKKGLLKYFTNFTRKHLRWSNFLIKFTATDLFIKKRLRHRCFLVEFAKFLKTPILKNICERLPLYILNIRTCISDSHYSRDQNKASLKKMSGI